MTSPTNDQLQDPPPTEMVPSDAEKPRAPKPPMQRAAIDFRTRVGSCPECGSDSHDTRTVREGDPLDDNDPNITWLRHRCGVCVEKANVRRETVSQEEARTESLRARLDQLAIPPYYAGSTLESFDVAGATEEQGTLLARVLYDARLYVGFWPDVHLITLFMGGPGTGKGHIAWSLARAIVGKYDATARVCVLSDLVRDLREAWARDEGSLSESQRLQRYRSVDLLVIDEVSRHAFYGQPQQHLYDLVAWRELQQKPTILTTNDVGDELAETLGPALSSRVLGGAIWKFGAGREADYRIKLARERRTRGAA